MALTNGGGGASREVGRQLQGRKNNSIQIVGSAMKRILALDGGGIRGVFTLEVLLRMEELLREHYRQEWRKTDPANADARAEKFVLRDHFDFIAGTSTGAIIATCVCWGMPAAKVRAHYLEEGRKMFKKVSWSNPTDKLASIYIDGPLSDFLKSLFVEDDGSLATLGSEHLRNGEKENLLMVVVRNHTTGSAWPLTNNPKAMFNKPELPDCNLKIPLWQLVRASTAAPVYFPPERVVLGKTEYAFIDGSITPYCNPALIAALTAILPGYRVGWTPGPENIRLVSVGTMSFSTEVPLGDPKAFMGYLSSSIPTTLVQSLAAFLQSTVWQQDFLCRVLGECRFAEKLDPATMTGENLDIEVGDLLCGSASAPPAGRNWFSYVRYNRTYRKKEMLKILEEHPKLKEIDAVSAIPELQAKGKEYAEKHVKLEHLV